MPAYTIRIRPEEIHFDFVRASGPGGQNVNKVATAVQLRFDAVHSQSIDQETRQRLFKLAGKRLNASGEIIIEASRFRTQQRNREDAMRRLQDLIEKADRPARVRIKSHPTAASRLRRLEQKRRRAKVKKLRSHATEE
jgi:ribosome-associated protein